MSLYVGPLGMHTRAAHSFLDCATSWFLPTSVPLNLGHQAAGLHLYGAMCRLVALANEVSAYAISSARSSPVTSILSVMNQFVVPVSQHHLNEWFIIPTTIDTFDPIVEAYRPAYRYLLKRINDARDEFVQSPCSTVVPTSTNLPPAAAHTSAVDATFEKLCMRSNTQVTTVGDAMFHLSAQRTSDSQAGARLMGILMQLYGANTTIEAALHDLCDDYDERIKEGITREEVLDARRYQNKIMRGV